jgi:hypothetical protein
MISSLMAILDKEVELRFGPGLRNQGFVFSYFQNLRYLAVGIIKVTKVHAFGRACRHTGRFQAFFDPVNAEGALVHISIGMGIACVVGAGCDAGPATNALVGRNQNNSSIGIMASTCGTASYAR